MRRRNEGWRTLRSGGAPGITPPVGPGGARRSSATPPPPTAAPPVAPVANSTPLDWPWRGNVGWTLSYVAFLYYIFVVTTFRLPGAEIAIIVALIGLPFSISRFTLPPFLIVMGAFVLWCVLGLTSTMFPTQAQDEVLLLAKIWLIGVIAVNVLRTPAQLRFFWYVFLGCFMLFPARGAIFNYLGGYNVLGRAIWNYTYANPNDLAALAFLPLSVAVGLVKAERFKWTRYLAIASVAILPLLILMTQSRGAFLALAFFGGVYLLGQRKRARTLFVMALLAVAIAAIAPRGVWERVRGLGNATSTANLGKVDPEQSARQRFEIWRVAFSLIRDNPVVGVGFGVYPQAHRMRQEVGGFARIASGSRDTHSTYLNVTAETGFPGLFLFLGTVLAALVAVHRVRRRWKAVLPAEADRLFVLQLGLVSFMIAGLFGSFSRLALLYLYMAFMYAAARAVDEQGASLGARMPVGSAPPRRAVARTGRAAGAAP